MTTTTARPRARRRWPRLAVPFAVLFVFWVATGIVHVIEEPNLGSAGTLSPAGTGRHGSSQLAGRLRERDVTIERVTSSASALTAAQRADATIFVPTPNFLDPRFYRRLRDVSRDQQLVVVQPSGLTAYLGGIPVVTRSTRWATGTADPDCRLAQAQAVGPAAVRHDLYDGDGELCYGGGLVQIENNRHTTFVVGASDPFRNDRIDESGNAVLASSLLGRFGHVIWVDVHAPEPTDTATDGADVKLPRPQDYRRSEQDRTRTGNALLDAFPSTLWAGLLLVLSAAALLAVARARRLGPPVAEPLPVLVPAAEAVTGRGRLYERIRAREATLNSLRMAAIARLARFVDRFAGAAPERELAHPGPAVDRFVALVAERSGLPEAHVRDVLYGPAVSGDEELVTAVAALDQLVAAVLSDNPDPSGGRP